MSLSAKSIEFLTGLTAQYGETLLKFFQDGFQGLLTKAEHLKGHLPMTPESIPTIDKYLLYLYV